MLRLNNPVLPATEVVVAAVGDVLLHENVQRHVEITGAGYDGLWSDVADLLRQADQAYANLESPLADGVAGDGTLVDHSVDRFDGHVYSGYPLFNAPSGVAAALARAGITVVSTANNHALDRRAAGIERTLAALAQAGIAATGTRARRQPTAPWHAIAETRGYRIAWLACTYGVNGLDDPGRQVLMGYDDRRQVLDAVARLAADPAIDAVIVLPHWGVEYSHGPLPRQRALAREAIDAGAAAVIGNHPHVVQPMEIVTAADGRQGLVAYSLGNFVSNQRSLACRASALLLLSLAEGADGRLHVAAARWMPLVVDFTAQADGRSIRVVAVDRTEGAADARDLLTKTLGADAIAAPNAPLRALSPTSP